MVRKAIRERFARQIAGEKHFFQVRMPPNGPRELSRAPREAVCDALGLLGRTFGTFLSAPTGLLGCSWAALGLLLGVLGALLGALGALLGALGALLKRSWDALGALRGILGASWTIWD